MRFQGSATYIASEELKTAVNAAVTLERPLLIKGEPGTGKTLLAAEIARALEAVPDPAGTFSSSAKNSMLGMTHSATCAPFGQCSGGRWMIVE